jgi:hypothetical protein
MKALRVILIIPLALYGIGALVGAIFCLINPSKQAEMQGLGEMILSLEKLTLLSEAMPAGKVWLYFSAIALLVTEMKEGYMFAITLGYIKLI